MTASGFGHLKATVGRDLVADSETRPCQQERLAALHIEIGIIRHVDEPSKSTGTAAESRSNLRGFR